jgi:hypothetical protein
MARAYLALEAFCTVREYSDSSRADHIAFWNIIQRLFPSEYEDESRLPDESLYVGDSPVAFGDTQGATAHLLIYRLCLAALERVLHIASEIVPNPEQKPWPAEDKLRLSMFTVVPSEGIETLMSLILRDYNGEITAAILDKLELLPLKTDKRTIESVLDVEYLRAKYRQTAIAATIAQPQLPTSEQTSAPATSSYSRRRRARSNNSPSASSYSGSQLPMLTELEAAALRLREEHDSDGKQRSFGQVADDLNRLGLRKRNGDEHDYDAAKAAYRNATAKDSLPRPRTS